MNKFIFILIITLLLSACGDSVIDTAQSFVPNNPPVINDITVKTSGGLDVSPSYLIPGNTIKFSVTASDSDGDKLKYSFSSETGSFATQTTVGSVCTVDFVIGSISGGQDVRVDISVEDGRGGKVSTYRSPGSSSAEPVVSVAGKSIIKPSDSVNVTLNADRNGYFQIVSRDQPLPVPVFDENEASYYFNYNTSGGIKYIPVSGKDSTTPGRVTLGVNNQKYYIFIIFRDLLNQTVTAVHEITADTIPPVLTASIPDGGYIKTGSPLRITSNEPVTVLSISGTAVTVPFIMPSETTAFDLLADLTSGIGKTININYRDTVGNTASVSMKLNVYDKEVFVRVGSDGNGQKATPYGNIQLAIDNLYLGKDEFGAVHVASGVYPGADNPVIKIDERSNLFIVGGYTESNFNQKMRNFNSTSLITTGVGSGSDPSKINPPLSCILLVNSAECIVDGFKMTTKSNATVVKSYYSGISCFGSTPVIVNNNITGIEIGSAALVTANSTYGIYSSLSEPYIMNNRITGLSRNSTKSVTRTYGLFFEDIGHSDKTINVINNSINGGGFSGPGAYNSWTTGISYFNQSFTSSLVIRNNTINAGISTFNGGNRGISILISNYIGLTLNIENNIVFMISGDTTIGIDLESSNASYTSNIGNNNIFGFTYSNERYNAAGKFIEGLVLSENISDHFEEESNDNYRLIDYSPANLIPSSIKSGGLDGAANGWGYTKDADGNPRTGNGTTGWTIGAFEAD